MEQIKDFAWRIARRKPVGPSDNERLGRRTSSHILNDDALVAAEHDNARNIPRLEAARAEPAIKEASHPI
jgi:hypothetical protein